MQVAGEESEDTILPSVFSHKYTIPSIASDPSRWNTEWEKVLHRLSSKDDVYPIMSEMYSRLDESEISQVTEMINDQTSKLQRVVVQIWDEMGAEAYVVHAWLLLDEGERKRHLMKGLMGTIEKSLMSQDTRALCPEITISSMLKRKGAVFADFFSDYAKAVKNVGEGALYFLPSEWWQKAADMPEPSSGEMFGFLTLARNEFIARFVAQTVMSVLDDMVHGSPGMNVATDILKSTGMLAGAWAKTLSSIRDKPVIRCENCTKSPEEIGGDIKFMLCSSCKSKLNFTVHYCSQACQKEDWGRHKKHCGKKKVSKKLRGTVHDPFWAHPDLPDHLRNTTTKGDGNVAINSIGFGTPHPAHPHSPALQRQVSLITGDKDADYFLFDDVDRPIRFVLYDTWTKMAFRMFRSDAMFSEEPKGIEALAEYLIKVMGNKPGLSRERILAQFCSEYGEDIASKLAEFERKGTLKGLEPGTTFLEMMSKNMQSVMPVMMNNR